MTNLTSPPIARGPLVELHRQAGGRIETIEGWEICVSYPELGSESGSESAAGVGNVLVDWSHRPTWELNGPSTGELVEAVCGRDVEVGWMSAAAAGIVCRLTPARAILFGDPGQRLLAEPAVVDVTGGWASLVLAGPTAVELLTLLGTTDLRESALPVGGCRQGPLAGVNTLLARFSGHWELHACPDQVRFLWDVILDAGEAHGLRPQGADQLQRLVTADGGGGEEPS